MLKKFTNLHLDLLDQNRLKVFEQLKKYKKYGYLAGGTALALQIGHRYSYDFDVFCFKKIFNNLIVDCRNDFSIQQVLVNSKDEFTFLTDKNVKLTFLYYPFVFKDKKIETEISLSLLSILDIATAKAYTLNRRCSFRDYVDLYFIIKNQGMSLDKIIDNAQKVYGSLFNAKLFLGQLVYVDDINKNEIEEVNLVGKKLSVEDMFEFFKKEVEKYNTKIISKST